MGLVGDFLDGAGWRHPAQRAADPHVRGFGHRDTGLSRPIGSVALVAASGLGPDLDSGAGPAVVRRDLLARRRNLLCRFNRRRHVEQIGGTGIARRAAWSLSAAFLGDVLARRAVGGDGGTRRLASTARAGGTIPARLAGTVLDRVRDRADQTAALCTAALSRNRHPHGRRA